jgi:hypothetical protein
MVAELGCCTAAGERMGSVAGWVSAGRAPMGLTDEAPRVTQERHALSPLGYARIDCQAPSSIFVPALTQPTPSSQRSALFRRALRRARASEGRGAISKPRPKTVTKSDLSIAPPAFSELALVTSKAELHRGEASHPLRTKVRALPPSLRWPSGSRRSLRTDKTPLEQRPSPGDTTSMRPDWKAGISFFEESGCVW